MYKTTKTNLLFLVFLLSFFNGSAEKKIICETWESEEIYACLLGAKNKVSTLRGSNLLPETIEENLNCCYFSLTYNVGTIDCSDFGTVEVIPVGGIAPFTYLFDTGISNTTGLLEMASAGVFGITVTDANCCTTIDNFIVQGYNRPAGFVSTTISSATISPSGNAPFTYLWEDGQITATATGLTNGSYSFTLTDANGCTYESFASVSNSCSFYGFLNSNIRICSGSMNGTITATANTGSSPYNYLWSTGETTATISNLAAGNYKITITDNAGCVVYYSSEIVDWQYPSIITSSTATTASVYVDDYFRPFSYLWDNGQTTETTTGLSTGTHCVTITHNYLGCVATTCVTNTNCPLTTSFSDYSFCGCDGAISLSAMVLGGAPPYSYQWENGANTATVTNLRIGVNRITVTDSNGCETTDSIDIINVLELVPSIYFSQTQSQASVFVDGGAYPYSFLWNTGETTAVINSISTGTYCLTITDGLDCTKTTCAYFSTACSLNGYVLSNDVCCPNDCSGTAEAFGISGSLPYSYLWSNGANTKEIFGLCSGIYTVTITDNSGCSVTFSKQINEPDNIQVTIAGTLPCDSTCTGILTAYATKGSPPYNYAWSNGANTPSVSGLCTGIYSVTVTDNSGCSFSGVDTITGPIPISLSMSAIDVTCYGACDGNAVAAVIGGTPPYTFVWDNGNTTPTINLCAGTSTVSVYDNNGCMVTDSIVVSQPDSISITLTSTPASSPTATDGTGTATVIGGTPPYAYYWDNSETVQTASNLNPGYHCVTVTDAQGCNKVGCVFVDDPLNTKHTSITYLNVYPNPASDVLYLDIHLTRADHLTYELYSMTGKHLQTKELPTVKRQSYPIAVGHLPTGIYFMKIRIGDEVSIEKFCLH